MKRFKGPVLSCAFVMLLSAGLLFAQSTPSSSTPQSGGSGSRRSQGRPCWQQAGVSQSVMQQHRSLEQNTRAEMESVCADSSLSQQQKHQKIQQIHAQARQQMQGLMTPQQEEALKSCRAQRGEGGGEGGREGGRGGQHGGGNPCGGQASGSGSSRRGGGSQSSSQPDLDD